MNNRNLLFIITGLGVGGAEKQVCLLADQFAQLGNKITIISLADKEILVKPQNKNIKIVSLNMKKNIFSFLITANKLKNIIKNEKPDVIHSHMIHANIFTRLVRIFVKIPVLISTAHNTNEGGKLRMFLYRITDNLATISTNVSKEAVNSFIAQKATTPDRMITVYNAIDTNLFSYNELAREKKRSEINLDDNTPIILSVGRLTKAKDYPNLFHAFSNLNLSKRPKLVIIGDGEEKENLQQLAYDLKISKDILWLGIRHDVSDWMSACDLFILPSAWEGFGLVVAEAMSCKRLVIGTNSGGVGEVINKYGLVIPPKNSIALASAITQCLSLPEQERNSLGILARKHIINTFSVEKISQQWLALYNELLNKNNDKSY
ncbi:glycosyltransferase [Proteus mirabilis]|uniref:glycosyltransferase n=1 Tax=Proteus mirabilis TaxID=584 RepID=UPI001628BED7|nr:glycosyltransferase [Proteus mirabilis]MBB6663357.1 glycosyltransferase [Proteus mirabilis]MBB6706779.1 glycosyltransferase [Proteus mirabilis]MBB6728899.1 glycosyltransferase [Proteus mirabilis]